MQRASNYAFKAVKAVTLLGQRITPSLKLTLGLSDFLMWNLFKGKLRTYAKKNNVKCKCGRVLANVFKRLVSNVSDADRLNLSAETTVYTHTHLLCHWRKESAGGDSGWPRLIRRSSAGGRRSGPFRPPGPWHSLPALPDNGLRERKMDVNIVTQMVGDGEGEKEG